MGFLKVRINSAFLSDYMTQGRVVGPFAVVDGLPDFCEPRIVDVDLTLVSGDIALTVEVSGLGADAVEDAEDFFPTYYDLRTFADCAVREYQARKEADGR